MKYLNTNYKKIAFVCGWFILTISTYAQSVTTSPFSRFGLGEISDNPHSGYYGLGATYTAINDSFQFNSFNPATYAFILPHRPAFDIGIGGNLTQLSSQTSEISRFTLTLRGISLGLPISKRWGMAFGITPVSAIGYNFVTRTSIPNIGDVSYKYEGSGGINRLYVGTAFMPVKDSTNKLSVGVNLSYLFGSINHVSKAIYDDNSLASTGFLHSKVDENIYIGDFIGEVGFLYKGKINKTTQINLGGTMQLGGNLYAKRQLLAYGFGDTITEFLIDTVRYVESEVGRVFTPKKISFGGAIEKQIKRTEKNAYQRLVIGAQYDIQDWGKYSRIFDQDTLYDNLKDSRGFGFGISYTPFVSQLVGPDQRWWQISTYRVGVNFSNTFLQLNNTQVNQYGISFGIGLPLVNSASFSMLNFGVEFGQRGSLESNLLEENFVKFKLGFILSPHRNDPWFFKRKYD